MDRTAAARQPRHSQTIDQVGGMPTAIGRAGLRCPRDAAPDQRTIFLMTDGPGRHRRVVENMYPDGLHCLTQVDLRDLLYYPRLGENLATDGWQNASRRSNNPL